ncbi:hypothetical protein HRbin36_02733 [bacterium HR36]|nr:hypothetical protein HRbin36_02733 [bacterium HR36]
MTRHEYQLPFPTTSWINPQEMRRSNRPVILVHTEQANIQAIPRIFEVVGVAAKKRDLFLGREDQPHIRVTLVVIQMVLGSVIKRNHITTQPSPLVGFLFDVEDSLAASGVGFRRRHARPHRRLHPPSYVFDAHEHVQFQIGAAQFLLGFAGVVSMREQIPFGGAQFLQLIGAHVMVGHHQTGGRNERAGASRVEPHAGLLQPFQPGRFGRETVALPQQFSRRPIEQPQPLLGTDSPPCQSRHGKGQQYSQGHLPVHGADSCVGHLQVISFCHLFMAGRS